MTSSYFDRLRTGLATLPPDKLLLANELAREHAGKSIEDCTVDDLATIRAGVDEQRLFLHLERDLAVDRLAQILARFSTRGQD